ncbi:MAG: bifunctional diguanylate cyclase/phosphodiesterase [Pseudohongiella sp.]|nr:bifunctional diguanylate cyclase/phosphodiesterase [Pseudohongiella sp.]
MVSLDNFKTINGTFGQDSGDALLIEISSRLQRIIQPTDTISRHGGDEFVVMLNNLGNSQDQASQALQLVAQTILNRLEDNYVLDKGSHYSTCSAGATLFGDFNNENTAVELIKQLDIALFNAKQSGRNRVSFFNPDWQAAVNERAQLLNDLRKGIGQQEFEMYFQPQVDKVGSIIGAEALVRWNHPRLGLLSPAEFIPLAEGNGLMVKLGDEIIHLCLSQLKKWQELPPTRHLKLSINITAEQFYSDGFVDNLEALFIMYRLDVSGIMLEFTESMLLHNYDIARENIDRLNALGVSFAIDDFGTGYSSLAYLSQLSMDQLKIDQTFVRNIGISDKDATIVRTIIDMARSLGMDVVAEGVETAAQRKYLLQHGCLYFQGYLFSRPVRIAEFNELVKVL